MRRFTFHDRGWCVFALPRLPHDHAPTANGELRTHAPRAAEFLFDKGADLRAEYCGNTPLDVASAGVRTACSEASRARYETLRELIADKVKPKKKPRMKKKPGDDI